MNDQRLITNQKRKPKKETPAERERRYELIRARAVEAAFCDHNELRVQ